MLSSKGNVSTYVDASHSHWIGAAAMADRLRSVGVSKARGFALNVSNFRLTSESASYGRDISARSPASRS